MKIRTRLKPEQASLLGLNVKKCDDGRDTARYYLNPKQREALGMSSTPNKKKPIDPINKKELVNDPKPFVLSAWNFITGRMLDIDEYCEFYGLPRDDVKSYKLVSHTGTPFFNILFKEQSSESNFNLQKSKFKSENLFENIVILENNFLNDIIVFFEKSVITRNIIDIDYYDKRISKVNFKNFNSNIFFSNGILKISKTNFKNNVLDFTFYGNYRMNDLVDYHLNFNWYFF